MRWSYGIPLPSPTHSTHALTLTPSPSVCNYLESVKSKSKVTSEMLARVPATMRPSLDLLDDDFMDMCNEHFDSLDVNGDGKLEGKELAPVIVEWVGDKVGLQ